MRLILFLLKAIVGLFAAIGFLLVAAIVLLAIAIDREGIREVRKVEVPENSVLLIEMSDGVVETLPESPFGLAALADPVVLSKALPALQAAADDTRIKGLVVRLGRGEVGLAQVQDLRTAFQSFRASGKFALAFAESFGEGGDGTAHYYLASALDEVWLQPSGMLDANGFLLQQPYIRGLLDELEITPRVGQREEYKGIASMLTESEQPDPVKRNLQRLVDSWLEQLVADVAEDRKLDPALVREAVDRAPLSSQDAIERKLIDRRAYWDEVLAFLEERAGPESKFISLSDYSRDAVTKPPGDAPQLAVIYGLGAVTLGESDDSPFGGSNMLGSETIAEALAEAREDDEIAAIVLRVDSPGGSYVASDTIWREVNRTVEAGKPLIVSMGNIAASGGYFISAPASEIVAQPATLTGSIGVVSGKLVVSGLLDQLGMSVDGVRAGRNAGFFSPVEDFSPEQWQALQDSLDRTYGDFLDKVSSGREMDREAVRAVAGGRVWSGADAMRNGLVDRLGGFRTALETAKEAAGIPQDQAVRLKVLPEPSDPFRKFIEDALGRSLGTGELARAIVALADAMRALRPLLQAIESIGESPRAELLLQPPGLER